MNFTITYKNRAKTILSNVIIEAGISDYMTVLESGAGKASENKIVWDISKIGINEVGKLTFKVKVNELKKAEVRETVSAVVTCIEKIVNNEYSKSAVEVLLYSNRYKTEEAHNQYIKGYADGTFKPDKSITRAEAATIFAKALGLDTSESTKAIYKDVALNNWATANIEAVTKAGLFSGYGNGEFHPNDYITRSELAAVIFKCLKLSNEEPIQIHFKDTNEHWVRKCIESIYRFEIVNGYEDGTFRPDNKVTRAEAIVMINKMLFRSPLTNAEQTFSDLPKTHWAFTWIEEAVGTHKFKRLPNGNEQIDK